MKKTISVLIFIFVILSALTSCGITVPRPEIKEGRFNISVTYEHNGEIKTSKSVYICEYDGINWFNINGDPCVIWKESFEGDIKDGGVLPICNTDDGGELYISLLLYPEYFMGDPEYADFDPIVSAEIFYSDRQINDAEIIAEYGVKLIGYECDKPIENTYK